MYFYGALRGALQAPYVGHYRVLHRGEKTYTIDFQGSEKTVSIERLKRAYVLHVDRIRFTAGRSFQYHDSLRATGRPSALPGGAAV